MHPLTARQPKRALIVEDNPTYAHMTAEMLEKAVDETPGVSHQSVCICGQWVATVAESAHVATALLRQNEYDVIVLDLMLSDTTGEQTVSVIREAAPKTAIVIHSSISDPCMVRRLLRDDTVQDYIVKGDLRSGYALRQHLCHAIDRWNTLQENIELCEIAHNLAA